MVVFENRYLFRIAGLLLFFIAFTSFGYSQKCKSGSLLYCKSFGETYVLLAGHKMIAKKESKNDSSHYLRGWAGFGGDCKQGETTIQAAIRETSEETRSAYKVDYLEPAFSKSISHVSSGFTTYYVPVEMYSEHLISSYPIPEDLDSARAESYLERGPYQWVRLSNLLEEIDKVEDGKVDISKLLVTNEYEPKYLLEDFALALKSLPDSTKKNMLNANEDSDEISAVTKQLFDEIDVVKRDIHEIKDIVESQGAEPVGILRMKTVAYSVREYITDSVFARRLFSLGYAKGYTDTISVTIDSVHAKIQDGGIRNIKVYTSSGKFSRFNLNVPLQELIPGRRSSFFYQGDKTIPNSNNRILRVRDVLEWEPEIEGLYDPDDASVKLAKNNLKEKPLEISTGLNNYLNVKVFSDLFGVFDNQQNGLVQTEVSGRLNLFNRQSTSYFNLFRYVEVGARISKFDDDFKELKLSSSEIDIDSLVIDRLKLNQLSYLSLHANLNYIQSLPVSNLSFAFDFGWSYDFVNFQIDSLDQRLLNLSSAYVDARFRVMHYKNFGLNFSFKYLSQKITKKNDLKDIVFVNGDFENFLIPEFLLFYNPAGEKEKRIYVRFRRMINLDKNHFDWLQFGYSTNFGFK